MEWTRTETIALAKPLCTLCKGFGLRDMKKGRVIPCGCVLRSIFRACYSRFRECAEKGAFMTTARLESCGTGKDGKWTWGRKDQEYIADFCTVSRRHLTGMEHKIFRYHYLLGADWNLCCRQTGLNKGEFFHLVYRVEEKLGRVFRELKPYGLFPLDEYFSSTIAKSDPGCIYRFPIAKHKPSPFSHQLLRA